MVNPFGCPIRRSADQRLRTTPRSLSQLIASFVASQRLGIHHLPFVACSPYSHPAVLRDRSAIPQRRKRVRPIDGTCAWLPSHLLKEGQDSNSYFNSRSTTGRFLWKRPRADPVHVTQSRLSKSRRIASAVVAVLERTGSAKDLKHEGLSPSVLVVGAVPLPGAELPW